MSESQPAAPPPIRGEPLPWSAARIEAASVVSATDADAAVALWKKHVAGPLGELLDVSAQGAIRA